MVFYETAPLNVSLKSYFSSARRSSASFRNADYISLCITVKGQGSFARLLLIEVILFFKISENFAKPDTAPPAARYVASASPS